MVPFRVFSRETKNMWVVLNYQPGTAANDRGSYLVAREDDDEKDGEMAIISADELAKYRLVDFLDDSDPNSD